MMIFSIEKDFKNHGKVKKHSHVRANVPMMHTRLFVIKIRVYSWLFMSYSCLRFPSTKTTNSPLTSPAFTFSKTCLAVPR